jgi:Fe-S cluster biosynthesis and repair protein YggX
MAEYLLLPFVEIEVRFGTLSKNFDSSVDKKYFNQIKDSLLTRKHLFKTVENKITTEFVQKKLKLINEKKLIMKENVLNKTFSLEFSPFDIKLSVNQEFSLNSYIPSFQKTNCITRKKERTSFVNDDFRYDLTIVYETENNITKIKYEIEIELLVNKNTLTWSNDYINEFIECKIFDLVKIVESIEREKFNLNLF